PLAALAALLCLPAPAARAEVEIYVTDYLAPQEKAIRPLGGKPTSTARLFAAPGEYEPASFALRPKERLASVMIAGGDLTGPAGTIPAANVRVRSVEGYHGGGADILMDLGRPWHMAALSKELFWITVKVPDDARPGTYRGACTVTSDGRAVGKVDVELEVLPVRLEDPPFALGYNYSSPKDPAVLAAQLADMRAHGMTVVAPLYDFHLPIADDDTSELGAFIEAYRKAGFRQPLYFATPMNLTLTGLTGYGSLGSKRFQQKYIEVMRKLWAEVGRHPGVPVFFSIGDELTNKGVKGVEFAGALARLTWEELPEIPTTSDMNGYREVMAMAPWLNVATFNNGWDGIDRHNEGRRLINKAFLAEVQEKTGAIPWFVNAGSGRFPFGLFFWKMTKYGARGKVEWYYRLGNNEKGSLVRTEGATIWPALDYERSREGIDDLKYLCALEARVAAAKKAGKAAAEVKAAEALLGKIADAIVDDWTAYTEGGEVFPADGFDAMDPAKAASMGHYNAIRRAVADAVMAIDKAM
ncbi:MAG: hypothetical protein IMZ55_17610, partial [Acidobacteria bacterium]|nr:hypothetical protein [Acidobacteriota bacterium]